jgi:ferredoxin--NADP+ reductase
MAPKPVAAALREVLAALGARAVSYADWQTIDAAERVRGQARGKPREKYTLVSEMITAINLGAT